MRISNFSKRYSLVRFCSYAVVKALATAYYEGYFGSGKVRFFDNLSKVGTSNLFSPKVAKNNEPFEFFYYRLALFLDGAIPALVGKFCYRKRTEPRKSLGVLLYALRKIFFFNFAYANDINLSH